jgi:hypothetical protein
MRARAFMLVALAGCGSSTTVTVVTVQARPAVHDADTLHVTFANGDATLDQDFDVGGRTFPLSFSVETPDRSGALTIDAQALDPDGVLTGVGSATAAIATDDTTHATLQLEPADFVVNTSVAGQQRLAWSLAAGGSQIAAGPDGTFTIGFTDDCGPIGRCDLWGRRFDDRGVPEVTQIVASDAEFNINVSDVYGNDPALAVGADGTLVAAWTTFDQILAVAITPDGAATSFTETVVSEGTSPGDPSVAALAGGLFVVVWADTDTGDGQRYLWARYLDAAGQPAVSPQTGGTLPYRIDTGSGGFPDEPSVAATGADKSMGVLWHDGTTLYARFASAQGVLEPSQQALIVSYNGADQLWSPRMATEGANYLATWAHRSFGGADDDGAIHARTLGTPAGARLGQESTLARGMPDSVTRFSLAEQDGAYQLVWEACGDLGDGDGCGIRERGLRATGLPIGDPVVVETTVHDEQSTPSISSLGPGSGSFAVTWTDASAQAPDTSETSIRARVMYPPVADAAGVLGAACGSCDDGLVCAAGSDGASYCHAACTGGTCPDGGTCTGGACVF